jgi:hypothetical protein
VDTPRSLCADARDRLLPDPSRKTFESLKANCVIGDQPRPLKSHYADRARRRFFTCLRWQSGYLSHERRPNILPGPAVFIAAGWMG